MLLADSSPSQRDSDAGALFDPSVRELLDLIAVELAAEYVRLMEAAAEASGPSRTHD